MTFRLMIAPSTIKRLMDRLFRDMPFVRSNLDAVVLFSYKLTENVGHVKFFLKKVLDHSLNIMLNKCSFGMPEVVLLGHLVDRQGGRSDPDKIKKIVKAESPSDRTEVRSFLSLAGYYRRFKRIRKHISGPE